MKRRDFVTEEVREAVAAGHQGRLAFPFHYDLNGGEWRVWRPDRCPHHFGRYKTLDRAGKSADRINRALYGDNVPSQR